MVEQVHGGQWTFLNTELNYQFTRHGCPGSQHIASSRKSIKTEMLKELVDHIYIYIYNFK